MTELILVGDQAFTPEELERHRNHSHRNRDAAYWRAKREEWGERYRQYQAQYQRVRRTVGLTDEQIERKIAYHRRLLGHYEREREYRSDKR